MNENDATPLLSVEGLSISYRTQNAVHDVVRDISFDLAAGEILGLAGESGCGKSTVARAAMGWLAGNSFAPAGAVRFRGKSLLTASRSELRALWGRELAYVPQEVSSGLNPSRRIGQQLREVLDIHRDAASGKHSALIEEALTAVGIDAGRATLARYPFEFSGGQQQRISIAMATLCKPRLLILDEPTTGIDATLRRELLDLLRRLLASTGMAAIYISHDLAEVADIADRLAILYAGRMMEMGMARRVFAEPRHPYARALLKAVPTMTARCLVEGIPGTPPSGIVHDRCSFADRCSEVTKECTAAAIPLFRLEDRLVRCLHVSKTPDARAASPLPAIPIDKPSTGEVLSVEELRCGYHASTVLDRLSFTVRPGELVGLVGESGSGKSTLLRTVAGLHRPDGGRIRYGDGDLARAWRERPLQTRREIQLIFQNPERSLNPRRTVRQIVGDAISLYHPDICSDARTKAVSEQMERVRLPADLLERYPHQLSGGEKQRVAIARAFAAEPALLLCDEIVSALDVSVQAVVMRLIRDYVETTRAAAIFVSHDLPVVRMMSSKVMVLNRGRLCEAGPTEHVFTMPSDDYTRRLIASLPQPA